MTNLSDGKNKFEWVEPIEWTRWIVRIMYGPSPTFMSKEKEHQSTISITEAGIYYQNLAQGLSFIPMNEIVCIDFNVERGDDESFVLMNIIHDDSLSCSSFALDCTIVVDELASWLVEHGIDAEGLSEEA